MLNSEFVHFMRTAFNPFMLNGFFHCYQLEHSISVLRDVRWYFFIFIQNRKSCNSEDPDQTPFLWRLIRVCAICLCTTKRALGIYG